MAAEDIRSQAIRNLDIIAGKDVEIKRLNYKLGNVRSESLSETADFIRHIERLKMRVEDLLMQRQKHLKELKRRDHVEFKADERLQEKDFEHYRLKLQIQSSDAGEEVNHQTKYVQTTVEFVDVRT